MPDTWARLRAVFDGAVEQEAEVRGAWLDEACAGDSQLRLAVDQLLEIDQGAGDFLDRPLVAHPAVERQANDPLSQTAAPQDDLAEGQRSEEAPGGPPARVGPYRLLRRIGQGGLGTVYLAVRDDDTFQRRVVVKLVRRDAENLELQRRLRTERQILAGLKHPYVAELYDGGTTEDHRPYFVMEYVEGVSIDTYCDQHQLSVDERVALFVKVCAAVHYAHQNLIVHRDLKPSNILITAEGDPKLLDFGIAKLLNPELAARELDQTATWLRLMTPHYASPEQVRGKLVTTASDIYSLGVLLYRLLTGRLPYRFDQQTPAEIERILTGSDPPTPSTAVSTTAAEQGPNKATEPWAEKGFATPSTGSDWRALSRQLAGDLDAIVMKALRSAPQRRYLSAERFAADLERFRQGLPVEARQGNWRYRTGKFLRRHRVPVGVAGLVLSVLLASGGVILRQSDRVTFERDQAQVERQRKQAVLDVMLDIFKVADPNIGRGETWTVQEALVSSHPQLRRRLRDEPELLAEVLHTTGQVYLNLGLWDRALEQLEEALRLRRSLHGDDHPDVAVSRSVLALALAETGDLDRADEESAAAVDVLRPLALRRELIDALDNRVTVLCFAESYEAAEAPSREALALARQNPEENLQGLADAIANQATLRLKTEEFAVATELYRESVEIYELLVDEHHVSLVPPINNMGSALRRSGKLAEAEAAFLRVLEIQNRALGEGHPNLAFTFNNLGMVQRSRHDPGGAAQHFRDALKVFRGHAGSDHPRVLLLEVNLAAAEVENGDAAAVVERLLRILPGWRQQLGEEHPFVVEADGQLGQALVAIGRLEEGEKLLIASFEGLLETGSPRAREAALERLRQLYATLGTPERVGEWVARLAEKVKVER